MDKHSQTPVKRKLLKKLFVSCTVIAALITTLLVGSLLLLPKLVSTSAFKEYAENLTGKVLTRKVRIDTLEWSWSDGIAMENIFMEGDPSFSEKPIFFIKNVGIKVQIREVLKGRLAIDVMIAGINFNYIREENGRTNLETLFPPQKADAKPDVRDEETLTQQPLSKKRVGDFSFSVPLDINAKIHLDRISLSADDRRSKRQLDINNGSIHFDMPSLYYIPVTLNVDADVRIDRREALPCRIAVLVKKTGSVPKEIKPENLLMEVQGAIPGVEFSADGGLGKEGLKSKINVSLGKVIAAAKPFLPDGFKDSTINGRLEFDLAAKMDSEKRILFDTNINASKIYASGQLVKNKQFGPVDLTIDNKGIFDADNGVFEINKGHIRLLKSSIVEWQARVSGLASGKLKADAAVSQAYFNLEEIYKLFKVFLPPDFPFGFHDNLPREVNPNVKIGSIRFAGGAGAEKNRIGLKMLALELPGFDLKHEGKILSVNDMVFTIEDAEADFKNIFNANNQNSLDVENCRMLLRVGDFLKVEMTGEIQDTAKAELKTTGDLYVNLGEIPEELFGEYKGRVKMSGDILLAWRFSGRLPDSNEKELLAGVSGISTGEALAFIDHADIKCSINKMKTHVDLPGGETVTVGAISASPLIGYVYNHKENTGEIIGNISMKDIRWVPDYGMEAPMAVNVSMKGDHQGLHRIRFSQEMILEPFAIEQSFDFTLFGADKILEEKLQTKPQAWLTKAGGSLHTLIRIKDLSGIKLLKTDLDCSGAMEAGIRLGLLPRKMVDAKIWANVTETNVVLGDVIAVNDFYGRLNIEKRFKIVSAKEKDSGRPASGMRPLSTRVMENAFEIMPKTVASAGKSQWHYAADKNRFNPERTVGFSSAHIKKGPVPINVEMFKADVILENGLPGIERFQNDIFGGTVSGAIKICEAEEKFFLKVIINFTGIDFETILPEEKKRAETEDTEVSGHLKLYIPITDNIDTFLAKMENHLIFTHIGSRALERLLYAVDPYESNEAIVSQRRLLKKGSPKWMELKIKDGSLSMRGELTIEGVDVEIPRLERLNITNLPGTDKYGGYLVGLKPVVKMLEIASSNMIETEDGELKVNRIE